MDNLEKDFTIMVSEVKLRQIIREELKNFATKEPSTHDEEPCPYLNNIPTNYDCLTCKRKPTCIYG